MKKLLILLFSLFLLNSPSVFADDISNYSIEGISVGDSLLDYMTEEEILEDIEKTKDIYHYLKEPNKYAEVYLFNSSSIYEAGLSFVIKNNPRSQYIKNENEKYTILSIRGMKNYIEDFDSCLAKKDLVVEELSEMFPNTQKKDNTFEPSDDPVLIDYVYLYFDSGDMVEVSCDNFEETFRVNNNRSEGLNISIMSKEIIDWLRNTK